MVVLGGDGICDFCSRWEIVILLRKQVIRWARLLGSYYASFVLSKCVCLWAMAIRAKCIRKSNGERYWWKMMLGGKQWPMNSKSEMHTGSGIFQIHVNKIASKVIFICSKHYMMSPLMLIRKSITKITDFQLIFHQSTLEKNSNLVPDFAIWESLCSNHSVQAMRDKWNWCVLSGNITPVPWVSDKSPVLPCNLLCPVRMLTFPMIARTIWRAWFGSFMLLRLHAERDADTRTL